MKPHVKTLLRGPWVLTGPLGDSAAPAPSDRMAAPCLGPGARGQLVVSSGLHSPPGGKWRPTVSGFPERTGRRMGTRNANGHRQPPARRHGRRAMLLAAIAAAVVLIASVSLVLILL